MPTNVLVRLLSTINTGPISSLFINWATTETVSSGVANTRSSVITSRHFFVFISFSYSFVFGLVSRIRCGGRQCSSSSAEQKCQNDAGDKPADMCHICHAATFGLRGRCECADLAEDLQNDPEADHD